MGESKTSPRRIEAIARQQKAIELRMAGRTFQEIADSLGYTHSSGAYMSVQAGLKKTLQVPSDHYRALNAERLNKILQIFWLPMTRDQNEKAAVICLKAIADLRALLGLDAPVKQVHTGNDDGPIELVIGTLAQRLQRIVDAEQPMLTTGSDNGAKPN